MSRILQSPNVIQPAPGQEATTAASIVAGDQIPAGAQKETLAKTYGDLAGC